MITPGPILSRSFLAVAFLVTIGVAVSVFAQPAAEPASSPASEAAAGTAADQKSAPGDAATASPQSGPRVRFVGPDTYILLDAEGRPQPMPGMSYEDFLKAWKQLNQLNDVESQPTFVIESINFDGATIGQRAELRFEAVVRTLAPGRTEIPLGLVGSILQGNATFGLEQQSPDTDQDPKAAPPENAVDEYLEYDADHGGFIAHLSSKADERRTIAFNLIVPLTRDGSETTLPINCPRALSSQLNLEIDSPVSEIRAANGAVLSHELSAPSQTTVRVAGAAGLFRLTWQASGSDAPAVSSILNALGAIRVTVDGRGVRTDARLTVRSYGGTFDQFRVRLPDGAQLIQARQDSAVRQDTKYRVRVEPDNSSVNDKGPRGQIAVVELSEKQAGPIVVDLATEQVSNRQDQADELNLGGFEVLGAVRQFGDVAINVASDWQARWSLGAFVRQVDPGDLDSSLQTATPTAAFQYDRQPWSLTVRVAPRQLRVHATPRFELESLADETRLTVQLAYQVFGSRAFEFRVNLDGWEMTGDPVESGGLVDQDRINVTPDGTLVLPLVQASTRRAEVSFSLRRPAAHDVTRLELPLPVPIADSVGTGEFVVRAAADIDLLPDLPNSTGLTSASTSAVSATEDGRTELHFRTLVPNAVLVTDRSSREQDVSARSSGVAQLTQDSV
jgi:hypothetical protein